MSSDDGLVQREASAALRERSIKRLTAGFGLLVQMESTAPGWDPRDAMINMTPFVDCARRLGHDPLTVLGPIARTGTGWFQETFAAFIERPDIALGAFGWELVETPDGVRYQFA